MLEHIPDQRQYRLQENPLHLEIRDAMQETLERARCRNVDLFLTGGIAASLLSREHWPDAERPLSRDLDFLVSGDHQTIASLEEEFGGKFILNSGKAIFKSFKLQSHAANGVELDFIASSNIVHGDAELSVPVTDRAKQLCSKEAFLGVEVNTLPPELIVLQKLFAGRGINLGKFDLKDSESIIASGRVDPQLFYAFMTDLVPEGNQRMAVGMRLQSALARLQPTLGVISLLEVLKEGNLQQDTGKIRQEIITHSHLPDTL